MIRGARCSLLRGVLCPRDTLVGLLRIGPDLLQFVPEPGGILEAEFIGGLEPAWARALRESFESAPPEQCVLAVTEAELPLRIQQSNGGVT